VRQRLSSELGSARVRALLGAVGAATLVVAVFSAFGQAAAQVKPSNTSPPTISGDAVVGSELTANNGTWSGTEPIEYSYRWRRCNSAGASCVDLSGSVANDRTYTVRNADVNFTLRVRVTARNADGQDSAQSGPTARVTASNVPPGAIKLPNGETSIPVTSVPATERLIVDRVDFSPNPVRTRSTPIRITVKVKDTRNYVVRDVLVFIRSTPVVTNTPAESKTSQNGTIDYTVQPEADFPIRNGYAVQFFVRARKEGDRPLAGIAGYRLVQVETAR
jgi:hypothetical protein